MQGALDASAIVLAEGPNALDHVVNIGTLDRSGRQDRHLAWRTGFRWTPKVEDNLDEVLSLGVGFECLANVRRHYAE
jgi:hypothetical protein